MKYQNASCSILQRAQQQKTRPDTYRLQPGGEFASRDLLVLIQAHALTDQHWIVVWIIVVVVVVRAGNHAEARPPVFVATLLW